MLGFWYYLLMSLFVAICIFMILLILIQKGRGGGLSGAFGGAGGNTAFGTKTGDVLTWATSIMFGVFLLLAIFLNHVTDTSGSTAAVTPPVIPAAPSSTTGSPAPAPTAPATPAIPAPPVEQSTPATQPAGTK